MGGVVDAVTDVVDSVFDTVGDVVEDVVDVVEDVVDGVGDFVGDIGEAAVDAVSSPIGQIAVSIAFPQYAAYINAAAKVANGQDLDAFDFVSLGIQGYSDLNAGVKVDPKIAKAASTAARIADGADPVTALVGAYGADFINETGLGESLNTAITDTLGTEAGAFVQEYMDLDQAAADLFAGEQPLRIISNQFGDEVVNNLAGDDPAKQALGYAGIRTAVGLDEGLSPEKALLRGAKEYYDRGGELPDLGEIASVSGFDIGEFPDLGINEFFTEIGKGLDDLLPEFGWEGLADINFDFGKVDLSGFDLGDFEGLSLPELEGMGINLDQLNIDMPQLQLALAAKSAGQQGGVNIINEDEGDGFDFFKRTTDNALLGDSTPTLSRQVLGRTEEIKA
jgi:hypothetical protein